MQCCPASRQLPVDICACGDKQLDCSDSVGEGGSNQRSSSPTCTSVNVNTCTSVNVNARLDEQIRDVNVIRAGGHVQCRASIVGPSLKVSACLNQERRHSDAALLGGDVQCGFWIGDPWQVHIGP